uniref:Uncharacterized protein n=1 Tax=Oryza brachyantha TaxID=4533 RepID=J3M7I3_ORYBR
MHSNGYDDKAKHFVDVDQSNSTTKVMVFESHDASNDESDGVGSFLVPCDMVALAKESQALLCLYRIFLLLVTFNTDEDGHRDIVNI